VSGFFPGMSLAVITGHCYRNVWRRMGNSEPVPESTVVMLGVRDLSPDEEAQRLERSSIEVVRWEGGKPAADVTTVLDKLATRVDEVYLHVDHDSLDATVAPGVSDLPVPDGLSLEDLEGAIRSIASRFRIRAAALTNYNPERDEDDKTLRAGLRIIPAIASAMALAE
jgi:arginase